MSTSEDFYWSDPKRSTPRKQISKIKRNRKFTDEDSAKNYLLKIAQNEKLNEYGEKAESVNYIDLANTIWDKKSRPFMREQCVLDFCINPSDCTAMDGCCKQK